MENLNLETGEYYVINNTKKILYWNGETWMKPRKDVQGRLGSYVEHLSRQPKVKSVVNVNETEYASLYKY